MASRRKLILALLHNDRYLAQILIQHANLAVTVQNESQGKDDQGNKQCGQQGKSLKLFSTFFSYRGSHLL